MKPYFSVLARYNVWATRKLYEQVDALSELDYRRDCGLFFKSIHGTLNHLLELVEVCLSRRMEQGTRPQEVKLSEEVETVR